MLDQDQREELGASSGTLFLVCKYQDTAVLGARVPMAEITFPFLFQFYADNLLGPPDLWEEYKLKVSLVNSMKVSQVRHVLYCPCHLYRDIAELQH